MATTSSSKVEDIISKSVLICSGSPALYQLTPKEEYIGTLRRMTLGEKDPNKINKTILLVGETGTGKSTLINTLVNYAMGVQWEDDRWFKIVKDEDRSQTESQTSDVIVYQVFGFEGQTLPYSLTITDTPGYGDTRRTGQDLSIRQRLLDLFCSEDGVHEINAVGLVLKASENRLSDRLRYIFDSVVSLFGKDLEKKIVALITHSDGKKPKNALKALEAANIKFAKDEKNQLVHFLFDNCQHEDRTEDTEDLERSYNITTKGMEKLANFLEKSDLQSLETTVDVMTERVRLTTCIQNLKDTVKRIENKVREIQQTQEEIEKYEEEMKKNQEFTVEVNEVYKDKEPLSGGSSWWGCGLSLKKNISCSVCEENCLYLGSAVTGLEHCEVMKDGRCTVCTGKCPVSVHVKENWIYVKRTRKVERTLQDMKDKYEKSKTDYEKSKGLLENLQENLKDLQRDKDQLLEESYQHVVRLEQIALNVDSLSTHVHLDFLIEKMKEKGDRERVQKLEEMKRRMDKGFMAALQYTLTAGGKEVMKKKYRNVFSKSVLVQSGSPTRYQLTPKRQRTVSTTLEENLKRKNKTVLLVGETGTGKSALINTLVNYAMGVKWEDDRWFKIVKERDRSQSKSQTSDVIVYQVFGFEGQTLPYSLTIIDTPGYGDTRGTGQDLSIRQRLLDLFCSEDGVHQINVVGLVLKASDNRLSDRLRYIFDSVVSLFGKDLEKKIVALITHSDGRKPKNALEALEAANIKCAKDEENQPVYFLFDNCQHEDRTEDTEDLEQADERRNKGMSQFTDFLKKTEPQRLETIIKNLQSRIVDIDRILQKQDEGKIPLSFGRVTFCHVCQESCHYPCRASSSPGGCEVMEDARCTVCSGKCPVSDHVKQNWQCVNETSRPEKTPQGVKSKAETKKEGIPENPEKMMKQLQREKDQLLEESFQLIVRLNQIDLTVHSWSTFVHLDFLIEKMKQRDDKEKLEELEKMKSQLDERSKAGLQLMLNKLKTAVRQAGGNK